MGNERRKESNDGEVTDAAANGVQPRNTAASLGIYSDRPGRRGEEKDVALNQRGNYRLYVKLALCIVF